jgi:hypothetical protein
MDSLKLTTDRSSLYVATTIWSGWLPYLFDDPTLQPRIRECICRVRAEIPTIHTTAYLSITKQALATVIICHLKIACYINLERYIDLEIEC